MEPVPDGQAERKIGTLLRPVRPLQKVALCARWVEALLPHFVPDSPERRFTAASLETLHLVLDVGEVSTRSALGRTLHARFVAHRADRRANPFHFGDKRSVAPSVPNPWDFLQNAAGLLRDVSATAHQVVRPSEGARMDTLTAQIDLIHVLSAVVQGYLVPRGGIMKERVRVLALYRRQAERARPLPGKPRKTPHAWDNATTRGLADRAYQTLDPLDAAVLADALEEANLPAELAAPYRGEPETLTRADWLFWHLACPTRVKLAAPAA